MSMFAMWIQTLQILPWSFTYLGFNFHFIVSVEILLNFFFRWLVDTNVDELKDFPIKVSNKRFQSNRF